MAWNPYETSDPRHLDWEQQSAYRNFMAEEAAKQTEILRKQTETPLESKPPFLQVIVGVPSVKQPSPYQQGCIDGWVSAKRFIWEYFDNKYGKDSMKLCGEIVDAFDEQERKFLERKIYP